MATSLIAARSLWSWDALFGVAWPSLPAHAWALLAVHALVGVLPLVLVAMHSPRACGDVLMLLAAVLFTRMRSARTTLAALQQAVMLVQGAALAALVRCSLVVEGFGFADLAPAARLAAALLVLWTALPVSDVAIAAARAAGLSSISPAEVAALHAGDAHWQTAAKEAASNVADANAATTGALPAPSSTLPPSRAPTSVASDGDVALSCALVAVHLGDGDAVLQTFGTAAAAAATGSARARRIAFATIDAARWPQLGRVIDIDLGLFSEQVPSVLRFVRGGLPRATAARPADPAEKLWLRRLPHVYDDGTVASSTLSLAALQLNFDIS